LGLKTPDVVIAMQLHVGPKCGTEEPKSSEINRFVLKEVNIRFFGKFSGPEVKWWVSGQDEHRPL
jgi:hypothetical protein